MSQTITITRILDGPPRGSSRPVLADSNGNRYLVKLRGAAQGTGPLVAEIIVAHLAEVLELPVLPRYLAILKINTPANDRNDELAELLQASTGLNLAFPMLTDALDATIHDLENEQGKNMVRSMRSIETQ